MAETPSSKTPTSFKLFIAGFAVPAVVIVAYIVILPIANTANSNSSNFGTAFGAIIYGFIACVLAVIVGIVLLVASAATATAEGLQMKKAAKTQPVAPPQPAATPTESKIEESTPSE